jgi:hypothetical protein
MPHRINIMLDDPTWEFIQTVPKGLRSRVMNLAIEQWAKRQKGDETARRMDKLRVQLPQVSTDEIVSWLQQDRQHN